MQVLLTGATGFVGAEVLREVLARPEVCRVRSLQRRPGRAVARTDVVLGDLSDLAGADQGAARLLQGVDAVIHVAALLQGSSSELQAVNAGATLTLSRAARRSGVARFVRLSTAAVYGPGPWAGHSIRCLPTRPGSARTRSRLHGDDAVLDDGGTVVRPHLVHGPADRWFAPRAAQLTTTLGAWLEPSTRHSTIDVADLAVALVDLALGVDVRTGPVLVSADPAPLAPLLRSHLSAPPPDTRTTTVSQALAHPAGRADPRWRHDITLLGQDHWLTDT